MEHEKFIGICNLSVYRVLVYQGLTVIEKFIREKRNNEETTLISFSSPKQQKQDQNDL